METVNDNRNVTFSWTVSEIVLTANVLWRNIPFKIQSGYFPNRKINFRGGNQLTGSVIVGFFQTSSLSAISRV